MLEDGDDRPDDEDGEHEPDDEPVVLAPPLELGQESHRATLISKRLDSFHGVRESTGMIAKR